MEIVLLLIVASAIFTAAAARSKGRDTVGWLLIGIVFPLISLIAIAAMSNRKETLDAKNSKACDTCGERVPRAAKICRFCNRQFDLEEERRAQRRSDMKRLGVVGVLLIGLFIAVSMSSQG